MSDIYVKLRETLDTLPNGFPAAESGVEIKILKKTYTEEEAEITCDLKMRYETPEVISQRTGRDLEYLEKKLDEMFNRGLIYGVTIGETKLYKLAPYVFGVYEFQLNRMDREFAELNEQYSEEVFGDEFFSHRPALMKVVPIEKDIPNPSVIEPHESIKSLIEGAKSWAVGDCICKTEQAVLDKGCNKPREVCLTLSPLPDYFNDFFWGRPISKQEAYQVLDTAEEAGLVHMTANVKEGHIYICNCCTCCCGPLRALTELGHDEAIARSNYRAEISPDMCTSCENCIDRCPPSAISLNNTAEVNDKCIGCGLCVSTCPTEAISLIRLDSEAAESTPQNEKEWNIERSKSRGREDYKNLL